MLELNKIYNMDCIEGMKLIYDKSIDMIFSDLPYQKTQNSWDVTIPFEPMWEQFERIIKDDGVILLFGQDKFTAKLMLSNEKLHRYNIIWDKVLPTGFLNANRQPLRSHEDICVFYKKLGTYNPQMTVGKMCSSKGYVVGTNSAESLTNNNYGDFNIVERQSVLKYPKSIWTFSKPHSSTTIHPTQKPLDLCRYAIRTYSNTNDIILDITCGSGSIPLSAKIEGRQYIGFDNGVCKSNDDKYNNRTWSDIATERISCFNVSLMNESKSTLEHIPGNIHKLF